MWCTRVLDSVSSTSSPKLQWRWPRLVVDRIAGGSRCALQGCRANSHARDGLEFRHACLQRPSQGDAPGCWRPSRSPGLWSQCHCWLRGFRFQLALRLREDADSEDEAWPSHWRDAVQGPRGLCDEAGEDGWYFPSLGWLPHLLLQDRSACHDHPSRSRPGEGNLEEHGNVSHRWERG